MKRKSFRRIYCLILTLLFLFGASFSANAGNGTQYGGVGVGYWTIGWNLTGGISHIHYSYNDNGGVYTYSTTSGINYKPRALFGCTSWDSALSSSIFTFTSTSTTVRDIRFEYVNMSWYMPVPSANIFPLTEPGSAMPQQETISRTHRRTTHML